MRDNNKTKNFTAVYNEVFQSDGVSARAKGLYGYIMTLPNDWKIYKDELFKHFSEGRDAMNKAFKELEELGYIHKKKVQDDVGRFSGWEYTIYETLTDTLKNRQSETPTSVNPQLLSTNNILNTKEQTYSQFLEKWNGIDNLTKHNDKIVAKKWIKKHTDQVELYGVEETLKAIENYSTIIGNPSRYYFSHSWTLWDFIARGLDKFVDDMTPLTNFLKDKKQAPNTNINQMRL